MRHFLLAALVAAAPVAAPAAAQTDPVLQTILAQSAKAPVVSFERTVRAELRADPQKEPALVVDRFVPTDAKSGKWVLVSIDGAKPSDKMLSAYNKNSAEAPIPGFHRLHLTLANPPVKRTEVGDRIIYRWNSLPAGTIVTPGGDISAHLSAEAIVEQAGGKPTISQVRIFSAQPFKIRGIATMNALDVTNFYRPGANGLPFLAAQSNLSDVSAPFGLGGKRKSQTIFKPL